MDRAFECLVFYLIRHLGALLIMHAKERGKKGENGRQDRGMKTGSHNPHFHLTVRPGSSQKIKKAHYLFDSTHDPSFFLYK